jgi:hypothetical protein
MTRRHSYAVPAAPVNADPEALPAPLMPLKTGVMGPAATLSRGRDRAVRGRFRGVAHECRTAAHASLRAEGRLERLAADLARRGVSRQMVQACRTAEGNVWSDAATLNGLQRHHASLGLRASA